MDQRAAMNLALACARSVEGRTAPRPPVGAVVVRDGVMVGQGATSPPYGPHAEVHALNQAGEKARGADLYVTLEPCCVTIHTPPCTRAIIAAGIQRVIVGALDPNPLVSGQGIAQLREAGIEVRMIEESIIADEIIRPFTTFVRQQRPYITAKWAMTLDGKIATHRGDAYWISSTQARSWVHNLRDRVDAILVGSGTVRADNPLLTVRLSATERMHPRASRPGPLRVVLSASGERLEQSKLLQPDLATGTCVIVSETCVNEQQLRATGAEVIKVAEREHGRLDLAAALAVLARKGLMHVLIEGGSSILGSAFDQQLLDHIAVFIAPKLIGGVQAPSPLGGKGLETMVDALRLREVKTQLIGDDILVEGEVTHNASKE